MTSKYSLIFLIIASVSVSLACSTNSSNQKSDEAETLNEEKSNVLDGTEKSLVVVGYSTSYAWPQMLQDMLDEDAGGAGIYHILNAVVGGSPVGRWIAPPDSTDFKETFGAMVRDFMGEDARLRGSVPAPTVAIVQQSLQRTPTRETRLGPVIRADDKSGVQIGADALMQLVSQLRSNGIDQVFIAMHIYKQGYEPQVGNERFALKSLLGRGYGFIHEGPDVWSLMLLEHPGAFSEDGLHPNERGGKIMAEAWYRRLAGDAAKESIIEAMYARHYDINEITKEYITRRRDSAD